MSGGRLTAIRNSKGSRLAENSKGSRLGENRGYQRL